MLAAVADRQGESSYSMKADRGQHFVALVLSMAGAFGQDKDEHVSCAAAKLPESHVCSKQFCLALIVSACSTGWPTQWKRLFDNLRPAGS